ncbi:MAG: hypothetical protein ABI618_05025, partial [Nitrospirota bacterium]
QGSLGAPTSAAGVQVSFSWLWKDRAFITYGIAFLILLPALLIWTLTFPRASLENPVNMDRILELTMELMPRTPVKARYW